jgi:hypothetical protein
VQHEGDPLGRRERLQDHQQGERDLVGAYRPVLGPGLVRGHHDRVGKWRVQRQLTPRPPGAQHVEAHPRDHGRQPGAQVADGVRVSAAQPQPRLLYGVVGVGERAEHPVGDRAQVRPMLLEILPPHRHLRSPASVMGMTNTHRRT